MAVELPAMPHGKATSPSGMLAVMVLIAIVVVMRLVPIGDTGMYAKEPALASAQPVAKLRLCAEHAEFFMRVEVIPSGIIERKVNGAVLTPADLYGGIGDGQSEGYSVGFYR